MKDKTMMRVNKELLKDLKAMRISNRESYAEVVKRIIDRERKQTTDLKKQSQIDQEFIGYGKRYRS